ERKLPREFRRDGDATIRASVVAHDDLAAVDSASGAELLEMAADRRERLAQPSFLVEDGDDDAQHVRRGFGEFGEEEGSGRAHERTRFHPLTRRRSFSA